MKKCKNCRWYYMCGLMQKYKTKIFCVNYIDNKNKDNIVDLTKLIGDKKNA